VTGDELMRRHDGESGVGEKLSENLIEFKILQAN
jgi:hypothetical protein